MGLHEMGGCDKFFEKNAENGLQKYLSGEIINPYLIII